MLGVHFVEEGWRAHVRALRRRYPPDASQDPTHARHQGIDLRRLLRIDVLRTMHPLPDEPRIGRRRLAAIIAPSPPSTTVENSIRTILTMYYYL